MAVGNFLFFFLTAIVAVSLIFAESEPPSQAGSGHQDPPPQDGPNQGPDGRFFFGYFRGCNYTATPGVTCLGCSAISRCSANNVAFVRFCRGFRRFCNGGTCSFFAPANCTASG